MKPKYNLDEPGLKESPTFGEIMERQKKGTLTDADRKVLKSFAVDTSKMINEALSEPIKLNIPRILGSLSTITPPQYPIFPPVVSQPIQKSLDYKIALPTDNFETFQKDYIEQYKKANNYQADQALVARITLGLVLITTIFNIGYYAGLGFGHGLIFLGVCVLLGSVYYALKQKPN